MGPRSPHRAYGVTQQSLTFRPHKVSEWLCWDGSVAFGRLPGTITLEESPYILRWLATLTSGDQCESNTAEVAVLFDSVDIRVEDPSGTPSGPVRDLVQSLGESTADPPQGTLYIDSPVFKVSAAEMTDRTSYVEYETHYEGCKRDLRVPFLARVWLKGKDGTSKRRSPDALQGSMVLWDFQYVEEFPVRGPLGWPEQMHFHRTVWGHGAGGTHTTGYGCHEALGGTRGSSRRMWRRLRGTWGLIMTDSRSWARYTRPGHVDGVDADSGIRFDPGRMAGDGFMVTAFFDPDGHSFGTPDEDAPYTEVRADRSNSLGIVLCRRVSVADNLTIGGTAGALNVAWLNAAYRPIPICFVPPGEARDATGEWAAAYGQALGYYQDVGPHSFVAVATRADPGGWPVRFRSYARYKARMKQRRSRWARWLRRAKSFYGVASEQEYRAECDSKASSIVRRTLRELGLTRDGLTLLRFGRDGRHNMPRDQTRFVSGSAPSVPRCTGRNRAVALVFRAAGTSDDVVRSTLAHEAGHALFLAHAPGKDDTEDEPAGCQPDAHWDRGATTPEFHCVMSYHDGREHLCGLCLVKLAGADYTKVRPDGTVEG